MTESATSSVGALLRESREAQGIALEEVAQRLRLMIRQVEAMEADDFACLGQPVFARGFVRNYARLLGIPPEDLLASMEGAPEQKAVVSHAESPPQHAWLSSPWLILLLLGILLLLAMPVVLYLWLNSGAEESTANAPVVQSTPIPASSVAAAAAPAMPAQSEPATPTADVQPAAPVEPAAAAEPVAAPVSNSVLHLEFGAESWTEIKDASGRMLVRQLSPAGSTLDVRGHPPYDLVIGNAAQVRMSYNGRPIDLNPFIDVTVARFTLEE